MPGGSFEGEVVTRWLRHDGLDRHMELMEDFAFIDPGGKRWIARRGSVIDGASIPEDFWSSGLGSPFVGNYRRASVLHDVHCHRRIEPARLVHRMFYDAMITDGVTDEKANTLYTAVRLFGPSWDEADPGRGAAGESRPQAPEFLSDAFRARLRIDDLEQTLDRLLGD